MLMILKMHQRWMPWKWYMGGGNCMATMMAVALHIFAQAAMAPLMKICSICMVSTGILTTAQIAVPVWMRKDDAV